MTNLEFKSAGTLTIKENISTAEQISAFVSASVPTKISELENDNCYLPLSGGEMSGTLSVLSPAKIVATGQLQCTGLVQFTNKTITGPLINCVAANFGLNEIVARTNSIAGHSEGLDCIGQGWYCHAEGESTIAGGRNSAGGWDKGCHAEGQETSALGQYSHAEGARSVSKDFGHAEGTYTYAIGGGHAEGISTYAAEGHAEGNYTSAFSASSHAEGFYTQTSGAYSFSAGQYAKTEHRGAFAWSGVNYASNPVYYVDHGEGTFNVNPKPISGDTDPASGFFVGETSLKNKLLPLSGETMPATPNSDELAAAVKKIFQKLGGTLT